MLGEPKSDYNDDENRNDKDDVKNPNNAVLCNVWKKPLCYSKHALVTK